MDNIEFRNNMLKGRLWKQMKSVDKYSLEWHLLRKRYLLLLPKRDFHDEAMRVNNEAIEKILFGGK